MSSTNTNETFDHIASKHRKYWIVVSTISVLLILFIGSMWFQVDNAYEQNRNQLTSEPEARADLLAKVKESTRFKQKNYLEIPTGVYIRSLSFISSNDVNLNGYIWQTYPNHIKVDKPGVYFPEEVSDSDTTQLLYTKKNGDGFTTYGWHFEVTVRQSFNYTMYPLDHKTVWLRMLSTDFEGKTLLIPDFKSYASTDIGKVFGLEKKIVLGNWDIDETFFDYKVNQYETNFGFLENTTFSEPELHFNVVLKRKFINAFVVHLIPMLTVAALLFAVFLTLTRHDDKLTINGFSQMGVIGSVSALFFVVVISHVDIRTRFPAQGIVYIEYFYLVMYVLMMAIVSICFLYTKDNRWYSKYFKEDALLFKLMYWPVSLCVMAIISYLVLL